MNVESKVDGEKLVILVEGLEGYSEKYISRKEQLILTQEDKDDRKVSELTVSELKEIIRNVEQETGIIEDSKIYQGEVLMFFAEQLEGKMKLHFHADQQYEIEETDDGIKVSINLPYLNSFQEVDPLSYQIRDMVANNPKAISEGIEFIKEATGGKDVFNLLKRR